MPSHVGEGFRHLDQRHVIFRRAFKRFRVGIDRFGIPLVLRETECFGSQGVQVLGGNTEQVLKGLNRHVKFSGLEERSTSKVANLEIGRMIAQ